jgi:glycerol-3-phosphate dehydrogenase subunit B
MSDVVVVGAGLAGLTAAVRLAEAGRGVTLLAAGVGGLHLSPGVIDVAGYAPERVSRPREGIRALAGNAGRHPYAMLGVERVERAIEWIRSATPDSPLVGNLERNLLLPTAVGVARPTALAPETMAAGDLRSEARYVIAGFRALKDLHPGLIADNLGKAALPGDGSVSARSLILTSNPRPAEADVSALVFARAMDDPGFRAVVADELRPLLGAGEIVGLPAVVGLRDAATAWRDLQERLGTAVFEIPIAPPSVPGIRLFDALTARLRRAGARMVMGAEVRGAEAGSDGVIALQATAAGRERRYAGNAFVLAPGGFESGGITLDSRGHVHERMLDLPLVGVPPDGAAPFHADYWADHPVMRAGVAVDERMRPGDRDGHPVHRNLYAAGGLLAGAAPWREKSGEGIAIASALAAADAILEDIS